jgi:D-arabinose 1-dehydrogenase-like Zn-dependent alcohol dehydrogenase
MGKPLLIIGCGGHGPVAMETTRSAGLQVAGFLDDDHRGEQGGVPARPLRRPAP